MYLPTSWYLGALNEHKNGKNWPKTTMNEHLTVIKYFFGVFANA
jgi:hypothetical protein